MTTNQLIELQQLKQEIRSKGYYIDITLHVGDEVLVQIGEPENNSYASEYGDTELSAIKLTWNKLVKEEPK